MIPRYWHVLRSGVLTLMYDYNEGFRIELIGGAIRIFQQVPYGMLQGVRIDEVLMLAVGQWERVTLDPQENVT